MARNELVEGLLGGLQAGLNTYNQLSDYKLKKEKQQHYKNLTTAQADLYSAQANKEKKETERAQRNMLTSEFIQQMMIRNYAGANGKHLGIEKVMRASPKAINALDVDDDTRSRLSSTLEMLSRNSRDPNTKQFNIPGMEHNPDFVLLRNSNGEYTISSPGYMAMVTGKLPNLIEYARFNTKLSQAYMEDTTKRRGQGLEKETRLGEAGILADSKRDVAKTKALSDEKVAKAQGKSQEVVAKIQAAAKKYAAKMRYNASIYDTDQKVEAANNKATLEYEAKIEEILSKAEVDERGQNIQYQIATDATESQAATGRYAADRRFDASKHKTETEADTARHKIAAETAKANKEEENKASTIYKRVMTGVTPYSELDSYQQTIYVSHVLKLAKDAGSDVVKVYPTRVAKIATNAKTAEYLSNNVPKEKEGFLKRASSKVKSAIANLGGVKINRLSELQKLQSLIKTDNFYSTILGELNSALKEFSGAAMTNQEALRKAGEMFLGHSINADNLGPLITGMFSIAPTRLAANYSNYVGRNKANLINEITALQQVRADFGISKSVMDTLKNTNISQIGTPKSSAQSSTSAQSPTSTQNPNSTQNYIPPQNLFK